MQQSVQANSISTNTPGSTLRTLIASWWAMFTERFAYGGVLSYLATWIAMPLFQIGTMAMIYGQRRPDLLNYSVVALAANASIFTTIYFVGEILDRERLKGTLIGLFLAPCPRLSWLTGFALVGVFEAGLSAVVALLCGWLFLGVRYDPAWPTIILTLALLLLALWGMGIIFSAIGLALKKANPFSNLVSPIFMLLGGVYYPIALLPEPSRSIARCVPFGYGMQALADGALHHAAISSQLSQLLPLAGFAVLLPCAGFLAFAWVERAVRRAGTLDLY